MALRFACISKNKTNPAYEGARIGAGRVAERLGASVDHYTPGIPDDIDQQEGLLRHALDSAPRCDPDFARPSECFRRDIA